MKTLIKEYANARNLKGYAKRFKSNFTEVLVYGPLSEILHFHDLIMKQLHTHFDSLDGLVFEQDMPTTNVVEEAFFISATSQSVNKAVCKEKGKKDSCLESFESNTSVPDHLALDKYLIRMKLKEERIQHDHEHEQHKEKAYRKRILVALRQMVDRNAITLIESLAIAEKQQEPKIRSKMLLILDMHNDSPSYLEIMFKQFLNKT